MENENGLSGGALEINAEIQTNDDSVARQATDEPCWFVFRYRILNSVIKDFLDKAECEIFFPQRQIKCEGRNGQPAFRERPIIPGYIFAKLSFQEAKNFGVFVGLFLWRRHYYDMQSVFAVNGHALTPLERAKRMYVTINDRDMKYMAKAAELCKNEIEFYDASFIDLERDDKVVFISGEYEGKVGYLRSSQGKEGGLVVVPLSDDKTTKNDIYYPIPSEPGQLGVIEFAKKNRHAYDRINTAMKRVDDAMATYISGENITPKQREQLVSYCKRYEHLRLPTDILRAKHYLILLRIYAILEMENRMHDIYDEMQTSVLPAYRKRTDDAIKRGRQDAEDYYNDFMEKMGAAITASVTRRDNIKKNCEQ